MSASGSILPSAEPDEKKSKEDKFSYFLYTYPGYPEGVNPESLPIIVVDHAKEVFERARLKGSLDNNKEPTQRGQGLVGVSWLGKNNKDEYVVYLDLLPAFNKGDNLPKTDKDGIPYKLGEFAYTDEPLGGNSGRNHSQFIDIIQQRIQEAYDSKDAATLKMYEGAYSIQSGSVELKKNVMHGFSVMKGDDTILLSQFRNVSANLNFLSVCWNREYLLINYYDEDIDDLHPREYYLRRPLPEKLTHLFTQAIVTQLPCGEKTARDCLANALIREEELKASSILGDPRKKIRGLVEALVKAATSKLIISNKKIKEMITVLEENIKIAFPNDEKLQKLMLAHCLNFKTHYNKKSIFTTALVYKNQEIIKLLEEHGGAYPDPSDPEMDFLLKNSLQNENIALFKALLKKGATVKPSLFRSAIENNQVEFVEAMLNSGKVSTKQKKEMLQLAVEIEEYHSVFRSGTKPEHKDLKPNMFTLVLDIKAKKINVYHLDDKGAMIEKSLPRASFLKVKNLLPKIDSISTNEVLVNQIASEFGCTYLTKQHDRSDICQLLLNDSKDSKSDAEFNREMLERAISLNKSDIVEAFLKSGFDVNQSFKNGQTPLFIAALNGHLNIIETLLQDSKININNPNEHDKRTPLIAAVAKGHVELVKLLLEKGADINLEDANRLTPLKAAVRAKKIDVVRILLADSKMDNSDFQMILTALEERQKTHHTQFIPTLDIPIMHELQEAIKRGAKKTERKKDELHG